MVLVCLQAVASSAVGDSSQLPLREENGETVLPFFWLDAYEDPLNQPGTVFLFGKVKCPNTKLYSRCVCVCVRVCVCVCVCACACACVSSTVSR